ncbi:MAG: DNA repair exonuclease [Alphaproteobacteria bacterium CG11_big_fil_rev_8_21_14_0_20_39_49]|nr:MAG: DNA repair exonuclease [Alphaproteobacteria bacterium CG11_big_fil_rev_8_21_14_0_20_39_49]
MFRFIHTADVHLDSPLRSLALKNDDAAKIVANATRQSFINTVDLCISEDVDALLIAGDLYDGKLRSMKTAAFFASQMRKLTQKGIRVFIIRGNHDAESKITPELQLPEGVHVFPSRGNDTTILLEDKGVALHGVSFAKPQAPESLLPKYPAAKDGFLNIGLLHTSLAGSPEHDVYAPCSEQDLLEQGYDYWALGHIHKRMVKESERCAIVMPGIPQGRHINESGAKSVTLVEISKEGGVSLEERFTSLVQFERISIDLTGAENWSDFVEISKAKLKQLAANSSSDNTIVRIELFGISPIANILRRDTDRVLEQLNDICESLNVFIEQCEVKCNVQLIETKSTGSNPLTDLRRLMTGNNFAKENIEEKMDVLLKELQKKLPPELRDNFEDPSGTLKAQYLNEGTEDVLARLTSKEETC